MQKRPFGNLGFEVSTFGFGAMRFQTLDGDHAKIDESIAIPLVRAALDAGVNYIDTAYVYHGGASEKLLAKALEGGRREKIKLATKLPGWAEGDPAVWEAKLDESLQRLKTDHIDFYLLHALRGGEGWETKKADLIAFLEKMVEKGKILYPSFSFHDDYAAFRAILDYYPGWKMAQVQFNFMDIDNQASLAGIQYAGEKGVPIVVMEPLHGGVLANAPDSVKALYAAFPQKRSVVEWAFRFVYNRPEVAVILSGINTQEQLAENLKIFDSAQANCLSAEEEKLFEDVRAAYYSLKQTGCTGCRYCMPCPQGVHIPELFALYDTACMFGDFEGSFRWRGNNLKNEGHGPDKCVACGLCEGKCPQNIPIIENLKMVGAK